jgi:hypothetical protein
MNHNVLCEEYKNLFGSFDVIEFIVNIAKQEILRLEYNWDFTNGKGPLYFKSTLFILLLIIVIHNLDEF